jgi:hypothetical protein
MTRLLYFVWLGAKEGPVETTLNSDRFCDLEPRQVYAQLLDEGRYLCHCQCHLNPIRHPPQHTHHHLLASPL